MIFTASICGSSVRGVNTVRAVLFRSIDERASGLLQAFSSRRSCLAELPRPSRAGRFFVGPIEIRPGRFAVGETLCITPEQTNNPRCETIVGEHHAFVDK